MSITRPFSYNLGEPISGTIQVGDLAVGTPTSGFTDSPQFWNGPDEELGYVIAYPDPSGQHPTPILGVTAFLGFAGTKNMVDPFSESTFLQLTNSRFNQNFTSGNEASDWLTTNGYWNSWVSVTPSPTPTVSETPTPTPTPTPTSGATPSGFTVTISEVGSDVVMSASGTLNINDLTLLSPSGTLGQSGLIVPQVPVFIMSSIVAPFSNFANYTGISTAPANIGTGGLTSATLFSGDIFGIVTSDDVTFDLFVPPGYTTGTPLSSSLTFNSQSFASLGLTPGTYTYTWGSGANADSVNVVIS